MVFVWYNRYMANYENLSKEVCSKIEYDVANGVKNPFAFNDANAVRRIDNPHDYPSVWRTAFIRDVDKIMHCPFYNRYAVCFLIISGNLLPKTTSLSIMTFSISFSLGI